MDQLSVVWNLKEEEENLRRFAVAFKEAKQVVMNSSSLRIRNIDKDFTFIGPVDDLSKVLIVYCSKSEGFRKIEWARNATLKESDGYFNFLAGGDLE